MSLRVRGFLAICCLALGGPVGIGAQPQGGSGDAFVVEHLAPVDGLATGHMSAILQDTQGFMWFGSSAGLHRYDGYELTLYDAAHGFVDEDWNEIPDVLALFESRDSVLWVGSQHGLFRFDRASERFTRFLCDPLDRWDMTVGFSMAEDVEGKLWVGTREGLCRFDPATETFKRYEIDLQKPGSLSFAPLQQAPIVRVYPDRQGILWLAVRPYPGFLGGMLVRFDPRTETFTVFHPVPDDPINNGFNRNGFNRISAFYEMPDGTLWLGTNAGLCRFVPQTEAFTCYPLESDDPRQRFHSIEAIFPGADGTLWLGVIWDPGRFGNHGLFRFDPRTETFSRLPYLSSGSGRSLDQRIKQIYKDRSGTVWVATEGTGVYKLIPHRFRVFPPEQSTVDSLGHPVVTAVHEGRDGTLWVGTRAGLDRINGTTGRVLRRYVYEPSDPASLGGNLVRALWEDRDGYLWIGGHNWIGGYWRSPQTYDRGGLDRFDPETETFTHYRHDPDDTTSLGGAAVRGLYEDRTGALWIATTASPRPMSLDRFNPETETFTHFRPSPYDTTGFWGSSVFSLFEQRNGTLWASTNYALHRFDRGRESFHHYANPTGFVGTMAEDSTGALWLGGSHLFLTRLDPSTGQITRIQEIDGFWLYDIVGLVADGDGRLWISTPGRGLARYNPYTGDLHTYDRSDGLPGMHFTGALHRGWSGTIYFGSTNGVVAIDPDRVRENPYVPPVVLTGFSVQNEPVPLGEEGPLTAHISVAEQITLAHNQNDFAFTFAALNYTRPEKNRYAYTLEGYEAAWTEAGTNREARYTNIPPGDYVFRVRGSNNDGVWNEEGATIRLVVLPPWWRTTWAYLLYGLLVACGIGAVHHLQRTRLLRKERAQARLREEHLKAEAAEERARILSQLDEAKTRFYANVSHEFRTPLTLLLGPIQDALAGTEGLEQLRPQLPFMKRNALRLQRLIDQLLDVSKLEAGQLQLALERLDLVPFLRSLVLSFSSLAEQRQITLHFEPGVERLPATFDPDKLEKVIVNLVGNALKFTPEGGKVRMSVRAPAEEASRAVEIRVRDTGPGIPPPERAAIFDRFHQVDSSTTRRHEGTGLGLALARELVDLHGGTIRVESEVGFGAEFIVQLPQPDAVDEEVLEYVPRGASLPAEVQEEAPEPEDEEEPPPPEAPEEAPTILIVEDHDDMRRYLRRCLASDYRIEEAADGAQGLEQVYARPPDLVLADVMMPEMDGYALCEALKHDPDLQHIPVVLLTARADEESKLEGLELGADDYLPKPFNTEELLLRIENLIELRRQLQARFSKTVLIQPSAIEVTSEEAAFLERAREVVEDRMGDSLFTPELLADEVGLSRRQLDRRMKALTRLSASGFIRKLRLERAASLLEQGAGTISEVAHAVGFQHPGHFAKLFHQTFGVVPSDYPDSED